MTRLPAISGSEVGALLSLLRTLERNALLGTISDELRPLLSLIPRLVDAATGISPPTTSDPDVWRLADEAARGCVVPIDAACVLGRALLELRRRLAEAFGWEPGRTDVDADDLVAAAEHREEARKERDAMLVVHGAIERAIDGAEEVTFEVASGNDMRCPMVAASTLRDIIDGRTS